MCGIVGEISPQGVDIDTFVSMRDTLAHRGPDGEGLYHNDAETVALGFRRLAIIDLTDAGNQPLANEDETVYLLFNGEIYNYESLRATLRDRGHSFTSETDSEVILHGYEEWGNDVLERLRGMFAFAIWDEPNQRLFLARDRLGIKPLCYYAGDHGFVFASEPKALLAHDAVPRAVSPSGLVHFLRYRYVPAPLTIWEGMYKLPQGHYLVYEDGGASVERYWNPETYLDDDQPSESDAVKAISDRLRDAVSTQLASDVPLGVLLSGGVDSSTVTALAADATDDLSTFSMGFDSDSHDELHHASTVADELGVENTDATLSPDTLTEILPEIIGCYDEPLADTSIFPTYLLMQAVSEEVTVALSGDGGDELFAGYQWYDRYLNYQRLSSFRSWFETFRNVSAPLADRTDSSVLAILDREFDRLSATGIRQYQLLMHPPIEDETLQSLLGEQYAVGLSVDDEVAAFADTAMDIGDVQYLDLNTFLPDDILVKVDRASMAHSLEVRPVFLDHRLVEYLLSLDDDLVYPDGEKKHLLKQIARREIPDAIVDRPKAGFSAPLAQMGFLETYQSVLEDSHAARDGVFDQETLTAVVADEHPPTTFKLILFELWYRHWVEQIPAADVVAAP